MGAITNVIRCKVKSRDLEPRRMSPGAVGYDLRADGHYEVVTHTPIRILTGVCVEIPRGFMGEIRPRSGLSLEGRMVVPGTIDQDYTGEVGVVAYTLGGRIWMVEEGDRIAQLVITAVFIAEVELVDALDPTWRDTRGFGSTGVK